MNASVGRVEFVRQVVRPSSRAGMGQGSQRNESDAWSAQDQEHSRDQERGNMLAQVQQTAQSSEHTAEVKPEVTVNASDGVFEPLFKVWRPLSTYYTSR